MDEIGPKHGQETRREGAQRGGALKRSKGQKVKTPKAQMQGNERTESQHPKGPNARTESPKGKKMKAQRAKIKEEEGPKGQNEKETPK